MPCLLRIVCRAVYVGAVPICSTAGALPESAGSHHTSAGGGPALRIWGMCRPMPETPPHTFASAATNGLGRQFRHVNGTYCSAGASAGRGLHLVSGRAGNTDPALVTAGPLRHDRCRPARVV
jgi:hypothetical protein